MNDRSKGNKTWNSSALWAAQESIDRVLSASLDTEEAWKSFLDLVDATSNEQGSEQAPVADDMLGWTSTLRGVRLGRFVIEDILGHGGFGVVFRAFDPELERHVAVKIPRPDVLTRESMGHRFLEEARVVAMLHHPGIVQVLDVGTVGPLSYVASELCTGKTLYEWMTQRAVSIEPTLAARIVRDLAAAIGYAHSLGVIHQDLKPSNVLLNQTNGDGEDGFAWPLRITDFGLACRLSSGGIASPAVVGGTRRYMAPEQSHDLSNIGTHTDVFALGVILYELLTGSLTKCPTKQAMDDSCMELRHAGHQRAPCERPRQIPRSLWAVCQKCLRDEPTERYQHAGELRDDLARFLDLKPVQAKRSGMFERCGLWCRKRPIVAGLMGAVLILALIGGGGVIWQWRLATQQRAIAFERLRASESLLVRMSWALDESYFWNDSPYEFESDFRRELASDFSSLVQFPQRAEAASLPAEAAALHRLGHQAFEEGDFANGERLTKQSLATWRSVRIAEPGNHVYRRSVALTCYYLAIYGFSSGKVPEQLLSMDREELVPGFTWGCTTDVELAEDLARLLRDRARALEKINHLPEARATHAASGIVCQQLAEHCTDAADKFTVEFAREHAAMGQCDAQCGAHERARTEFLQAAQLLDRLLAQPSVTNDVRLLWINMMECAAHSLAEVGQLKAAVKTLQKAMQELECVTGTPEAVAVQRSSMTSFLNSLIERTATRSPQ